jgi:hypothetical protein
MAHTPKHIRKLGKRALWFKRNGMGWIILEPRKIAKAGKLLIEAKKARDYYKRSITSAMDDGYKLMMLRPSISGTRERAYDGTRESMVYITTKRDE